MSACIQGVSLPFFPDARRSWAHGNLFVGFSPWTIVPLLTQACGGFMVGLVTKHAGSVAKGYTVIIGILISILLKSVVEAVWPKPEIGVAVVIVMIAIYFHTVPGTRQDKKD